MTVQQHHEALLSLMDRYHAGTISLSDYMEQLQELLQTPIDEEEGE